MGEIQMVRTVIEVAVICAGLTARRKLNRYLRVSGHAAPRGYIGRRRMVTA